MSGVVLGKPAFVRDSDGLLVVAAEADGAAVWLTVRRCAPDGVGAVLLKLRTHQGAELAQALRRADHYARGGR